MTIYELAKKANVSIATVSRAINPATRKKVAPETLSRIDALIYTHGYTPSLSAKNLSNSKSSTIGVLFPKLSGLFFTDYYMKIISGISDALLDSTYTFKPILLNFTSQKWDNYNFKAGHSLDGLIIIDWPLFFSSMAVVERLNLPTVLINDPVPDSRVNLATSDHLKGGELAADYLWSKGHRHVAIVTGGGWSRDCGLRIAGFTETLKKKARISKIPILEGNFEMQIAGHVAAQALKKDKRITAFFCLNDIMAFGVLQKLKDMNIACPEKISVIGYDGDDRAAYSSPPLTTIRVPICELVTEATKSLLRSLESGVSPAYKQMVYPVTLVERGSVGKAP